MTINLSSILLIITLPLLVACEKGTEGGEENGGNTTLPQVPSPSNTWIVPSADALANYKAGQVSNKTELHMARNEAEHFQLVIETPAKGKLTISQAAPVEGLALDVREIKSFNGADDILIPVMNTGIITTTKVVKLWVSYRTSKVLEPGEYKNVISLKGSAGEILIGTTVRVYNATVPSASALPALFGINSSMIGTQTGEALMTARKEISDLLLTRRLTPYFCTWLAGTMKVECITSPYPWDDARTYDYLADDRLTHVLMPNHALSPAQIGEMGTKVSQCAPDKKQLYYIWDEPTQLNEYTAIKELSAGIHAVNANAKILTTFFRGPNDANNTNVNDLLSVWDHLSGGTSIFCTGVWSLQQNEGRSELCRNKCKAGEEWWMYVCMGDTPGLAYNSTGIQNRATTWRAYKEQTKGFLYWAVNAFSSLSPLRVRPELPAGDGVLVYPGAPFDCNQPVVSLRLERFADGLEDYDLLTMLEAKKSRQEALAILEAVYRGPGSVVVKGSSVDEFKKNLLNALDK